MTGLHFVILALAVWRVSNLIANETGPFYVFQTIRSRVARAEVRSRRKNGLLSKFHLYELLNCEYCNSVWNSIFFTAVYLIAPNVALALAFPLALSTGAIIIKKVVFVLSGIDTYFDRLNNPIIQQVVAEKQPINEWDARLFEQFK